MFEGEFARQFPPCCPINANVLQHIAKPRGDRSGNCTGRRASYGGCEGNVELINEGSAPAQFPEYSPSENEPEMVRHSPGISRCNLLLPGTKAPIKHQRRSENAASTLHATNGQAILYVM